MSNALDIDEAVEGAFTAACWADLHDAETGEMIEPPSGEYQRPDGYRLGEETMRLFRGEMEELGLRNPALVAAYVGEFDSEHFGHVWWLTRGGHGTGFWDHGHRQLSDLVRRAEGHAELAADGTVSVWG